MNQVISLLQVRVLNLLYIRLVFPQINRRIYRHHNHQHILRTIHLSNHQHILRIIHQSNRIQDHLSNRLTYLHQNRPNVHHRNLPKFLVVFPVEVQHFYQVLILLEDLVFYQR